MAARKFTCTHCSGTGKQRIPYTRTASDRVCERCAGTGVLALEDAAEESFQVRPPIPRRLLLAAPAHAAQASAPSGSSGALCEEAPPAESAPQNKPGKPPSSKVRTHAASADTPPRSDIQLKQPLPKSKSSEARKTQRKRAK